MTDKLKKLALFEKDKNLGIFAELQDVNENIKAISDTLKEATEKTDTPTVEFPKTIEATFGGVSLVTIKGDKGEKGEKGEIGITGTNGLNGKDGKDGKNGVDGEDGGNGKDGKDGTNGKDGKDGKDGSPDTSDQIIEKVNSSKKIIKKERVEGLEQAILNSSAFGGNTTPFFNGYRAKNLNIVGGTATQSGDTVNVTIPSGSGDVVGPASAINGNVVFFDGTTGKLIKDSGLALSGTNTGDQTISDATLSTSDITTNNFTTAKHGFVPKGTNVGSFLKDDGTWGVPAGSGDVSKVGIPANNQVGVWTGDGTIEGDTALTFDTTTDTLTTGILNSTSLTASEIVITDASKNLTSAPVATYPSLTELTYVKGATSAIQTQINAKQATITFGAGVQTALGVNVGSAGAPVLLDGALGTPSSGTLTNATGLPLAGVVDSTTEALGVGSLELGHATDTTIARVSAGVASIEGNNIVVNTSSPTLATITTTGNIELGHASDTTISRVSAGVIAVEGVNVLTVAGGTTTGNIQLGENTSIALDPAGSADGKYTGLTIAATAGEALAFGDVIVLDVTAGKWFKGSVSAAAGADGDLRGGTGMCVLAAAGDASATTVLLNGTCRADSNFPALTIGSVIYATTTGDITVTQPTTTDHIIKVLGYALTADEIYFNPSMDYITHT